MERRDFSFETTLASRSFMPFLKKCIKTGYQINIVYFYLQSPEIAIKRVSDRIASGGHDIPKEAIERRYHRSLDNLFKLYMLLATDWVIYDNSFEVPHIVAKRVRSKLCIIDEHIWDKVKGGYNAQV